MRFSYGYTKLFLGRDNFVGGWDTVMPVVIVFHERNAFALYCVGDDGNRFTTAIGNPRQHLYECSHVVPINLACVPSERPPLVRQWIERQNLLAPTGRLPLVEIDDRNQTFDFLRSGKHGGLPDGTLIAFAVREQCDNVVTLALDPR